MTNARHAIVTQIREGELHFGKVITCRDYVRDVNIAVQRLLCGEVVKILQYAQLTNSVQRTIEAVLKKPTPRHTAGPE